VESKQRQDISIWQKTFVQREQVPAIPTHMQTTTRPTTPKPTQASVFHSWDFAATQTTLQQVSYFLKVSKQGKEPTNLTRSLSSPFFYTSCFMCASAWSYSFPMRAACPHNASRIPPSSRIMISAEGCLF